MSKDLHPPISDDDIARYDPAIQQVIRRAIASDPPPHKKGHRAKTSRGERTVRVVGNPENPDAAPAAVDFRHHRSRIEKGK